MAGLKKNGKKQTGKKSEKETSGRFSRMTAWLKKKKIPERIKLFFEYLWMHKWIPVTVLGLLVIIIVIAASIKNHEKPDVSSIGYRVSSPHDIQFDQERLQTVVVRFNASVAPLESIEKTVEGITIKPGIPGTWIWVSDNTLEFSPDEQWTIGKEYNVTMDPSIFAGDFDLDNKFSFSTNPIDIQIGSAEFYIDPQDSKIKRVTFSIQSNYPMDPDILQEKITIVPDIDADTGTFKNREYDYTVNFDENNMTAYVVSEPLGMPVQDISMQVSVDKGIISTFGGEPTNSIKTKKITIPGSSTYVKILSISHDLVKTNDQRYEQILFIETKGEVNQKELMDNLSVYILPKDRPELPGIRASEDYRWKKTDEVVQEVLNLSTKVDFEYIPCEKEYNSVNSLRFKAETDQYMYVKLNEGTRFYGDYFLAETGEQILYLKEFPKELEILSDGAILSMTGDKKLTFMTRGIGNVSFQIGRIRPDDINHLVSQSNGSLENFYFDSYSFNEYNISEIYRETRNIHIEDETAPEYFSYDLSKYLQTIPEQNLRYGLFIFEVRGLDGFSNYRDKRLIIVTDLGFFVKKNNDNSREVFVQSIATGRPVSNVTVEVLGKNGNPVVRGYTDSEGHVNLPELSQYKYEHAPTVYVVRNSTDLSFMPYQAYGRNLDYSDFNVGGARDALDANKINAYLFSDRGIYRPGDEIRIAMIVKAGDWSVDLENTPLEYNIVDSKGNEIHTRRLNLSSSGFEEAKYRTMEYSPTGEYSISMYLIKTVNKKEQKVFLGSTTVKVEEFLPDNLNITTAFSELPGKGWINPEDLKGIVTVRNLFGKPAENNEVTAQIILNPGYKYFSGYRDYTFFDPYRQNLNYTEYLGVTETDANGTAEFPIDLGKFEKASYNINFFAEAFEKGSGRSVSSDVSIFVSPLAYLIGYRVDGSMQYINKGSERKLEYIAINSELEQIAVSDLTLSINETRYISALVKQPNGLFKYQSVAKSYPISEIPLTIKKDGYEFMLPTDTAGEFQITVKNSEGLVFSSFNYSIIGSENIERSLDRSAQLDVRLNKEDYQHGETIELFIRAPYTGAGLITIECDKVYSYKWFRMDSRSTEQKITVPADLNGNGYVSVALVRSLDSKEIFMSPLSYSSIPFSVSKENQTNIITLDVPGEAKPGQPFPIKYKTEHKGKILIYAVDEGILQVARYNLPDPLGYFIRKRALEVSTSQILDLILPEFSIAQSIAAMGGGGDAEYLLDMNLNPFKRKQQEPVAYWSGILDSSPAGVTVYFDIPDYFNGSLRVMAITVSDERMGTAQVSSTIRDTFIIKPNHPMAAAPGDEFEVALTVANNLKGSGPDAEIRLNVTSSRELTVISGNNQTLKIPEGKDIAATLRVRANNFLGGAELNFTASSGRESSSISSYLSVRPPMPYRIIMESGLLTEDSVVIETPLKTFKELSDRSVSVSYLPLGLASGLKFYLEKYPYGCTEQIVSWTFPDLFPNLIKDLDLSQDDVSESVSRTISILQARQKNDGSFGLWTWKSKSWDTIDIYSMHFLTTAMQKGYFIPTSMLARGLEHLRDIVNSENSDIDHRAYAVYVLTLNEIITTQYIESLLKVLKKEDNWETSFSGLYLAASYKMMQQDSKAESVMKKIGKAYRKRENHFYYDDLAYASFYLHVVCKYFPGKIGELSSGLLQTMADLLRSRHYSTFSAGNTLMGIESYLQASPDTHAGHFTIAELQGGNLRLPLVLTGERLFNAAFSEESESVEISNPEHLNLFYKMIQAGFEEKIPESEQESGMEVFRIFKDDKGREKSSFAVGEDIYVTIRFRTTDVTMVRQVAIVDLLPAGFEIDIPSVRETENSGKWRPDYVDIREDRIILYGDVTNVANEFTYKVKAINRGTFIVPPVFAEAMYNKDFYAIRPRDPIIIE